MTETILALVPDYGLALVFCVVFLACLAVPLPASVLVLTAGSFAAVGDLELWQTFIVTAIAFVLGAQAAFWLAYAIGPQLLGRLRGSANAEPVIRRSEVLLARHGSLAVLLSHTVLSPICPYVCYLSGAGGLPWARFTVAAVPGALIWAAAYVGLGHMFASQLEEVAALLSQVLGAILAACAALACLTLLLRRWRRAKTESGYM